MALSLLPLTIASPVMSQEAPPPMGPEFCFPTKDITKTINKMEDLKDDKRDTVGLRMEVELELEEGELPPERLEVRDGDRVTALPLDADHKTSNTLSTLRSASEDAQFCVVDPAREGRARDDMGYEFNLGMNVGFLETTGTHSLEQIEDGLKDGRSHYKKMVGAMGFMVPKFDYVAAANDTDTPPRIFATKGGQDIGEPPFEMFDNSRLVSIDDLEDMGADGIRVEQPYRLSPSPDAETIAKFSGGDEDE